MDGNSLQHQFALDGDDAYLVDFTQICTQCPHSATIFPYFGWPKFSLGALAALFHVVASCVARLGRPPLYSRRSSIANALGSNCRWITSCCNSPSLSYCKRIKIADLEWRMRLLVSTSSLPQPPPAHFLV